MRRFTSRSSLTTVLCFGAVLGFAGGIVCARGAFPSLERAMNDYGTLSSDLRAAIDEVKKKEGSETQKDLVKKQQLMRDLEAEFERITESQKHTQDILRDLETLYGSNDGKDTSPPPTRKRP